MAASITPWGKIVHKALSTSANPEEFPTLGQASKAEKTQATPGTRGEDAGMAAGKTSPVSPKSWADICKSKKKPASPGNLDNHPELDLLPFVDNESLDKDFDEEVVAGKNHEEFDAEFAGPIPGYSPNGEKAGKTMSGNTDIKNSNNMFTENGEEDPEDLFPEVTFENTLRRPVNTTILYSLFGASMKKKDHVIEKLRYDFDLPKFDLKVDFKTGVVTVTSKPTDFKRISGALNNIIAIEMENLKNKTTYVPYMGRGSGIGVNINPGLNVNNIEFDNDDCLVLIFVKYNNVMDKDKLGDSLKCYGNVVQLTDFGNSHFEPETNEKGIKKHTHYLWGKARFQFSHMAQLCIDGLRSYIFDTEVPKSNICMAKKMNSNREETEGWEVVVTWQSPPWEVIRVFLGDECSKEKANQLYSINIRRSWYRCKVIRPGVMEVDISRCRNKADDMKHAALKEIWVKTEAQPKRVEIVTIKDELKHYDVTSLRNQLESLASREAKHGVRSYIIQRSGSSVKVGLKFDKKEDLIVFKQKHLLRSYKDAPIFYEASSFTNIPISRTIYNVIKGGISVLKDSVQKKYGDSVIISETINARMVYVKIQALKDTDLSAIVEVLHKIMKPEVLADLTPDDMAFLNKVFGKRFIGFLEKKLSVKILLDEGSVSTTRTVRIYGSPSDRESAKIKLKDYIKTSLYDVKCIQLHDIGPERPLINAIIQCYGMNLRSLSFNSGAHDLYLDTRRCTLFIHGDQKAFDTVHKNIEQLAERLQKNPSLKIDTDKPLCVACWSPTVTEPYRTELCGHIYCRPCMEAQLNACVSTKDFPILCAQDGCEQPLLWQDVMNIFKNDPEQLQRLIRASVSLHVSQNSALFGFCSTPDCPAIFLTPSSSQELKYDCRLCNMATCRSCHVPFHEGMSCGLYKVKDSIEEKLLEWMKEDPENRRVCPKCGQGVEKISGCYKVECASCKCSMCWKCTEYFDNCSACYEHLDKVHGGYF